MNPLFQKMMSQSPMASGNAANALPPALSMMQKFIEFKNAFKGNAKEQVEDLLKSGKMSQEQFEQLKSMAESFKSLVS